MSEDQRGKSSTDLKFTSMPKQPHMPQELYMDNTAAIRLSTGDASTSRTKHLRRRDWKLKEVVQRGLIEAKHVVSTENLTDTLYSQNQLSETYFFISAEES